MKLTPADVGVRQDQMHWQNVLERDLLDRLMMFITFCSHCGSSKVLFLGFFPPCISFFVFVFHHFICVSAICRPPPLPLVWSSVGGSCHLYTAPPSWSVLSQSNFLNIYFSSSYLRCSYSSNNLSFPKSFILSKRCFLVCDFLSHCCQLYGYFLDSKCHQV